MHSAAGFLSGFNFQVFRMNYYHIWCNIRPGIKDLQFVAAVRNYLGYLQAKGHIEAYTIARRKFGFSPPNLGDFHITIHCRELAQLDDAFKLAATRDGEVERLHAPVFSSACDTVTALYRDFPDEQRKA
jgi:hypothetical protein